MHFSHFCHKSQHFQDSIFQSLNSDEFISVCDVMMKSFNLNGPGGVSIVGDAAQNADGQSEDGVVILDPLTRHLPLEPLILTVVQLLVQVPAHGRHRGGRPLDPDGVLGGAEERHRPHQHQPADVILGHHRDFTDLSNFDPLDPVGHHSSSPVRTVVHLAEGAAHLVVRADEGRWGRVVHPRVQVIFGLQEFQVFVTVVDVDGGCTATARWRGRPAQSVVQQGSALYDGWNHSWDHHFS